MPDGLPKSSVALKFGFDTTGPSLGPVQLLENTRLGFAPLPPDTLEQRLARAFFGEFDCADWSQGLGAIARAMNEGDLAKAAILTQFLSRPRLVARLDVAFTKASPDDPDHPGWPKDSPDGKGGEFRPLDDAEEAPRVDPKQARIDKLKARRQVREVLKRVLTKGRAMRLLSDLVGDAIPYDVVSEAATIADLYVLARDISQENKAVSAALAFAERGPQELKGLLITEETISFGSYKALVKRDLESEVEKRFGPAGDGYQYHHIVEQGANRDGFAASQLQSTSNVVRLPTIVHEEVSAVMSKSYDFPNGRMPLRDYLRGAPFERQRAWGLWAMRQAGALK